MSENDYLYVDRLTSILAPQPDGSSIGALLLPAAMSGEISLIVMAPIAVKLSAEAGLEGAMLPVVVAGTEAERMLRPEYRAVATVLGD